MLRVWRTLSVAIAAVPVIAASGTSAVAAEDCAPRFQASLASLATAEFQRLEAAIAGVTRQDPTLPGTWMFFRRADRLKARLAARLQDGPLTRGDKVCAETTIDRGGRIRCLKWVDKSDAPPRPIADLSGARDAPLAKGDLAQLNTLWRIVRAKGSLEEFDKNGRFFFLVTRSRDELGEYVRQPLRPGLCSGAPEVMGFYDSAFAPMRQRIDLFAKSAESARQWVGRELKRLETETASPAPSNVSKPGVDDSRIVAASTAKTTAIVVGADTALESIVRRHISEALADKIATAPNLIARLALVEDALATPAAEAESSATTAATSSSGKATPNINIVPALRALEALAYAELALARARHIDEGFKALMGGVTDAHRSACTCER